jgi:hypothetical protein
MAAVHCRGSVMEISTRSYKLMNNLEVLGEVRGRWRVSVKRSPSVVSRIWVLLVYHTHGTIARMMITISRYGWIGVWRQTHF